MDNKKKLNIKKSIVFVLLLVTIIILLNSLYLNFIFVKKIDYRKKILHEEYISNLQNKTLDYGFFGSSHSANGIYTKNIPNSYNFASNGASHFNSYYQLYNLLYREKILIKNVIFEIDLHTFSSILNDEEFTNPVHVRLLSKDIPFNKLRENYDYSPIRLWLELNFPFIGNGKEFEMLFKEPETEVSFDGWNEIKGDYSNVADKYALAIYRYHEHFVGQEMITNISLEYFKKSLKLAEDNNITIFFIKMPVPREYDEIITRYKVPKEDYYSIINNEIDEVIKHDYAILDYYGLFFDHPEFFADGDHLNRIGAIELAKRIAEDLKDYNNIR